MKPTTIDFAAPVDVQIAQARAQGIQLAPAYYALAADKRAQALTVSGLARLDQVQAVADALAKSQANGETFADFQKWAKTQDWVLPRHRLETIYRNSVQTAYNAGHWREFEENARNRPYLMYDAINDSRVRPSHLALDGVIKPVGDAFWKTHSAPLGHRCLLPGTRLKGDFRLGSKAAYSGPAVEIETATGKCLSVTVNHPILTSGGWVAAGELKKGARLLCDSSGIDWVSTGGINNEQPPPTVEDVFESLRQQAFGSVSRDAFDLHGDAKHGKGDINVAGADCELMHGFKPNSAHCVKDRGFIFAGMESTSRALKPTGNSVFISVRTKLANQSFDIGSGFSGRIRYLNQAKSSNLIKVLYLGLKSVINAVCGLPGGTTLALNSGPVVFHRSPLDGLCLAGIPWGNAIAQEKTSHCSPAYAKPIRQGFFTFSANVVRNNFFRISRAPLSAHHRLSSSDGASLIARAALHPSLAQQTTEKAVTDICLFEKLHFGCAGQVAGDEVVGIKNFTFSGHVYDFQTDQGWMFAQGLVVSNCRCVLRSLSRKEAMRRGGVTQSPPAEGVPDAGWGSDPRQWGQTLRELVRERINLCGMVNFSSGTTKGSPVHCQSDAAFNVIRRALASVDNNEVNETFIKQSIGNHAWEAAKAELLSRTMPPAVVSAGLTMAEQVSLYTWTLDTSKGPWFSRINRVLRMADTSSADFETVWPLVAGIKSAMDKLPPFEGVVYRAIKERGMTAQQLTWLKEAYQIDSNIALEGYSGASKDLLQMLKGRFKLSIMSKSGRDISALSSKPSQAEVLIPHGAVIRVKRVLTQDNGVIRIWADEIL